jgi:hypothetical protein
MKHFDQQLTGSNLHLNSATKDQLKNFIKNEPAFIFMYFFHFSLIGLIFNWAQ